MMTGKFLSPRTLATAIGVSESSLKRWTDDGLLSATRTAGGHRRIAVTEAIRFVRSRAIGIEHPEVLGLPATRPLGAERGSDPDRAALLVEALKADDGEAARSIIVGPFLRGASVASICDGPIRGALTRIGELWKHGHEGILIEHRATDTCVQAINVIRSLLPAAPTSARRAVTGAPPADPYLLPSLMASAVLAEAGFRDLNLGPETPGAVYEEAIELHRPALVCLALNVDADTRHTRHLVETLAVRVHAQGGTLIVGGRGAAPSLGRVAGVEVLQSMRELAGFARALKL